MIVIERNEMNDPNFKDNTSVHEINEIAKETNCAYEVEDGKIARLIKY